MRAGQGDYHALGRHDEARRTKASALELAQRLGDLESQIEALSHERHGLFALGERHAALEIHARALHLARTIGNPALEYRCLADIGRAQLGMDALEEAIRSLRAALALAERIGLKRNVFWTHERLSFALERAGDTVAALHHYRAFHAVEREVQGERATARARTLALQFETDRAQREAQFERQRSEAFAEVNAALNSANEEKSLSIEQLRFQASHDALTGLPNRSHFEQCLENALVRAAQSDHSVGVMFIDLDGFKRVNDTLGHHRGDHMLIEVAQRFRATVGDSGMVARMGGDEFTVILGGLGGEGEALQVAQHLIEALEPSIQIEEREIALTASIGLSFFSHDGVDAATLTRCADLALYRAKDIGKNAVRRYQRDS